MESLVEDLLRAIKGNNADAAIISMCERERIDDAIRAIREGAAAGGTAAGGGAGAAPAAGAQQEAGATATSQYNRLIHPFTEGETLSAALRAVSRFLAPLADLAAAFLVREGRAEPMYIDMRALVTSATSPLDLPLQANDRIVGTTITVLTYLSLPQQLR